MTWLISNIKQTSKIRIWILLSNKLLVVNVFKTLWQSVGWITNISFQIWTIKLVRCATWRATVVQIRKWNQFVHMCEITRSVIVALRCLIAVVLVDVDLPYWTLKVEHLVAFTAIFSNICTTHAQKRLFMNFQCKFRHRRLICRPRFPFRVQNFSDLATFSDDFCILYAECPPYFYFRFVWPTDLESLPHASNPTSIIPTRFEVDMPSYSIFVCWYVTRSCDLDLWPFVLEQMSYMASQVTNLATKYEDPTPIRSSVMSYNVSRWLPLKVRTRPLRMRRITWPVSRGSETIAFLGCSTLICLFTIQPRWLYDESN